MRVPLIFHWCRKGETVCRDKIISRRRMAKKSIPKIGISLKPKQFAILHKCVVSGGSLRMGIAPPPLDSCRITVVDPILQREAEARIPFVKSRDIIHSPYGPWSSGAGLEAKPIPILSIYKKEHTFRWKQSLSAVGWAEILCVIESVIRADI